MPISSIDGCSAQHWAEVLAIISDAVTSVGFEPALVSETHSGIIQGAIVENLYRNPIVVCDVSAKNPNVMFELGMRLAFDKPTVVIKDETTEYSFDTSPIAHLGYPRDLRFSRIVEFKAKLAAKVAATHAQAQKGEPEYKSFLKHFGTYTVAGLDERELTKSEAIFQEFAELKRMLTSKNARASFTNRIDVQGSMTLAQLNRAALVAIKEFALDNKCSVRAAVETMKARLDDFMEAELDATAHFGRWEDWEAFRNTAIADAIHRVELGMS